MTGTALLQVDSLSYSAGGRALLQHICLSLGAGEVLAVVGRNGAGKSTLLKTVSGELRAGGVQMFGEPLERLPRRELARRRGVLAQQTQVSFGYEVLEVVALGRLPHGDSPAQRDAAARLALARVGLEGFEQRDILTLSGGEQQRVQLARVLAQLSGTAQAAIGSCCWMNPPPLWTWRTSTPRCASPANWPPRAPACWPSCTT